MISLTRKCDYGLVALGLLVQRWHEGDGPISAAQISRRYGLPRALLSNILKELAQARIVTATRGAAGGYELALAPQRISLLEVVSVLEGPVKLTPCSDGLPIVGQGCPLEAGCPIRTPIRRLNAQMRSFLEELSLQDLVEPSPQPPCCEAASAFRETSGQPAPALVSVAGGRD